MFSGGPGPGGEGIGAEASDDVGLSVEQGCEPGVFIR
jgi:hypothetical protein